MGACSEFKAAETVKSSIPDDVEIIWFPLDLRSTKSISNVAEKFNAQSQRLDMLVLNASVMSLLPGETEKPCQWRILYFCWTFETTQ